MFNNQMMGMLQQLQRGGGDMTSRWGQNPWQRPMRPGGGFGMMPSRPAPGPAPWGGMNPIQQAPQQPSPWGQMPAAPGSNFPGGMLNTMPNPLSPAGSWGSGSGTWGSNQEGPFPAMPPSNGGGGGWGQMPSSGLRQPGTDPWGNQLGYLPYQMPSAQAPSSGGWPPGNAMPGRGNDMLGSMQQYLGAPSQASQQQTLAGLMNGTMRGIAL